MQRFFDWYQPLALAIDIRRSTGAEIDFATARAALARLEG
jgi:hypothetical protein